MTNRPKHEVSLARRARATPDYLASKKVIIQCFGARELTQADAWKRLRHRCGTAMRDSKLLRVPS